MTRVLARVLPVGFALAAALLSAPAAADSPQLHASGPVGIIGGTATTANEYPSVVLLIIGGDLCTGTLIDPSWVMTAAHCVDPGVLMLSSQSAVTAAMEVHFHTLDFQDPGTLVRAKATFKDQKFDQNNLGSHDMGLIELATPVTDVTPSPVNLNAAAVSTGMMVTTVGYGAQSGASDAPVGTELELMGRASTECSTLGIGSDSNLLCFSQANMMGTCQGDSGGPSFAMINSQLTVVGVTSFGDDGCTRFSAATRVDAEIDFLADHVTTLVQCLQDADCQDKLCFNHICYTPSGQSGGLGETCAAAADCNQQVCAQSSEDGNRCSLECSISTSGSCPDGFDCLVARGDVGACWPSDGAGCQVSGGSRPGAMLLGVGVLAIVIARRRRRRARR